VRAADRIIVLVPVRLQLTDLHNANIPVMRIKEILMYRYVSSAHLRTIIFYNYISNTLLIFAPSSNFSITRGRANNAYMYVVHAYLRHINSPPDWQFIVNESFIINRSFNHSLLICFLYARAFAANRISKAEWSRVCMHVELQRCEHDFWYWC